MSNGLDGAITDQRDSGGRFGVGNTFGRGRPKRVVEQEYLSALHEECSVIVWRSIVQKAIQQASEGEPKARTFLAHYVLGKPCQSIEVNDTTEKDIPSMTQEELKTEFEWFRNKYPTKPDKD